MSGFCRYFYTGCIFLSIKSFIATIAPTCLLQRGSTVLCCYTNYPFIFTHTHPQANHYYKLFISWTNQKIKSTFVDRNIFEFKHIKVSTVLLDMIIVPAYSHMIFGPTLYQHKYLLIEHTILLIVSVLRVNSYSYAVCRMQDVYCMCLVVDL